jgi:hypothetical protein
MMRVLWHPSIVPSLRGVIACLTMCRGRGRRVWSSHAPLPCREVVLELIPRGLACGSRDVVILPLAEVGLLKVASYGDDSMRVGHLKL